MREPVSVIASFNRDGEIAPLYVKISKFEKDITLKVQDFKKRESSEVNRYVKSIMSYRCCSVYNNKDIEFTLEFHNSSSTWYITASNSTINNMFRG